jgi:sporulation protein YlmC with PRC-barrel domain
MAHYGLLHDYRFEDLNSEQDIRGSNVYGRDNEKLGKIDDVIFDHSTGNIGYVVVDTQEIPGTGPPAAHIRGTRG